jgi:hypothetical protein
MKRRTLDIIFSIGGATLAVLVLVLGLVLRSNAVFAQNYVHDQLSQQKITFTPVAGLSPEEAKSAALVKYAGQPLTTGAQAQAYANDYIAGHLAAVNNGKTYAETSGDARAARAAATDAQSKGAANAAQLDKAATVLEAQTQTLFRGETLRGLLLTSYGFSIFGDKAMLASWVCLIAGFVLLLASAAGFVHAFRTSKNEAFAPVEASASERVPAAV